MNKFLQSTSVDFGAVRDGRRSMPLWFDIDLSIQRRISDGTAEVFNIAGNSFYADSDSATVGFARVHFQDANLDNASAPFFVSPGFIAAVPFTQILVENEIQAGKRLRIFYGVDVDFQAGVNASIAISGNVGIDGTVENRQPYPTNRYSNATPLTAWNPILAFTAGSNGAIITDAHIYSLAGSTPFAYLIECSSAPTSYTDGVIYRVILAAEANAGSQGSALLVREVFIRPSAEVRFVAINAETAGRRSVSWRNL